jgi:hypothetical protein
VLQIKISGMEKQKQKNNKMYINYDIHYTYNYTLYKNTGLWLVNSRDIFYKCRPCIVNLQNFYFM